MKWDPNRFIAYDPYMTFSLPDKRRFITSDGKSSFEGWRPLVEEEEESLWTLGKSAFDALHVTTNDDFNKKYREYLDGMQLNRELLSELHKKGELLAHNSKGGEAVPPWLEYSPDEILNFVWQIFEQIDEKDRPREMEEILRLSYLFACLKMIERLMISHMLDRDGVVHAALSAASAFATAQTLDMGDSNLKRARRELAFQGAMANLRKNSKKQADKNKVRGYWNQWQQKSTLYKSQAEFARDMLEKFGENNGGSLTSTDTIVKKWIPEFKKAVQS